MNQNRAITYSLLAHIREKAILAEGPIDIFKPLVKRALSLMNEAGKFSGKNISEIKQYTDDLYQIEFPIPVLRQILLQIALEVNSDDHQRLIIYKDDSFQITDYYFTEIEEAIQVHTKEVEQIEKLFKEFCRTCGESVEAKSIFDFIDNNRASLAKYLSNRTKGQSEKFSLEAQFVSFFKEIPQIYEIIKGIYIGSILSSFIEYKAEPIKENVELLLDTNYVIGLLDLNTPESYHTCWTLMKYSKQLGYRHTILQDTIDEINGLLRAKASSFNTSFLVKKIFHEDIFNACDRRKLNGVDLERIADNLESWLIENEIEIIYHTEKYVNIAKFSKEYKALMKVRESQRSALHDATAIHYVRQKRGKPIFDFDRVNCWFLNNSSNRDVYFERDGGKIQPDQIKADDLLNILWLSFPALGSKMNSSDIADIGLSSLISLYLSRDLPKTSVIRELDDNIQKYANEEISDSDLVKLSKRITSNQLKGIEKLNEIAKNDKVEFVKRLESEVEKQKEEDRRRNEGLSKVIEELKVQSRSLRKKELEFDEKIRAAEERVRADSQSVDQKDLTIENLEEELLKVQANLSKKERKELLEKREFFLHKKLGSWRRNSLIFLVFSHFAFLGGVLWFLYDAEWDFIQATTLFLDFERSILSKAILFLGGVLFSYSWKLFYDRFHNHSNIENFKKGIRFPDEISIVD